MTILVAPSLLAGDFLNLEKTLHSVAQADMLHLDIMDGMYVPNLTFGPFLIPMIKKASALPLDIHIMAKNIEWLVDAFIEHRVASITFHAQQHDHPYRLVQKIKAAGIQVGLALNPGEGVETVEPFLGLLDKVLVMTVNPGFCHQTFIEACLPKVKKLSQKITVQVDGGIHKETAKLVREAGAKILVSGGYVFSHPTPLVAIQALRGQ